MKASLKAATKNQATALRLKRQEVEASVERNLAALQLQCETTRRHWREHTRQTTPPLSLAQFKPDEEKHAYRIEQGGGLLFDQFKASAPKPDCSDIGELQTYFTLADRTSIQIEQLASQLQTPQRFRH